MKTFYCPLCNYKLKRLPNKKVGYGYFWMCSNINNGCRTFFEDDKGKPIDGYKHQCPFCYSGVTLFNGQYGLYWSCLDFKNCGKKFKDNDGEPIYPVIATECCVMCDKKIVLLESKKGKSFWGCSGFPKCKEIYKDIDGKPDLGGTIIDVEIVKKN